MRRITLGFWATLLAMAYVATAFAQAKQPQQPAEGANEFAPQVTAWTRPHSVILLPITNKTNIGGQALVTYATGMVQQAMRASRMVEIVAIHKHNPSIRRAMSGADPVLTEAEVEAAINEPVLENVLTVGAACGVDYVAEIQVDSYKRPTKPEENLEVVLSGTLYGVGTGEAVRKVTVTGASVTNPTVVPLERLRDEAFQAAATALVNGFTGHTGAQQKKGPAVSVSKPAVAESAPAQSSETDAQQEAATKAVPTAPAPEAPQKDPPKDVAYFLLGIAALLAVF